MNREEKEKVKNLNKYWTLLEDILTGVFFVSGLGLIFYGVLMRYVFNNPKPWVEEISMYSVIWGILFGLSVALRNDHHIAIDLLYDVLSPKLKRLMNIFANLVGILFCIFFIYYSFNLVSSTHKTGMVSLTVGIPMWIIYVILPISGTLFLIRFIERFIQTVRKVDNYDHSSI